MSAQRRVAARASTKRSAIAAIYAALDAPGWAAANLDALADVLRDLSWLPEGQVRLDWHVSVLLPPDDREAIAEVLQAAQVESAGTARPLRIRTIV